MGTKNNPGGFDCYGKLEDDEPYFVLRARDPSAAQLVREWALQRRIHVRQGLKPTSDDAQVAEALLCAEAMEDWRETHRSAS